MKTKNKGYKKIVMMLAVVFCLGVGMTAFAQYECRLTNNGKKIGSGSLVRNTGYATASTSLVSSSSKCPVVTLMAYNKSGKALKGNSDLGSLTAVTSVICKNPHYYRSTHAIKKSKSGPVLDSRQLYAYK